MMKVVKIKFVGFWSDFEPQKSHLYRCLAKNYDVKIVDDADYIICSVFGPHYEYCKYPQVRILYTGENYLPDLNLVDYAICNYPIILQDRCFYFPFCIDEYGHCESLQHKKRNYDNSILTQKIYFANFIAGHESEYGIRGGFFKKLCKYKRVESVGSYLYNMPNGERVQWNNDSKTDFQRKCKFTLCFESTKHEGFITEKIMDAFYSDTIPVYYGSSSVKDIFNPKAFINCSDYENFDDAIQAIIELDQDDEKYLEMLRQPIFIDEKFPQKTLENFEKYLCYIFDQDIEQAYRRSRVYSPKMFDEFLSRANVPEALTMKELLQGILKKPKYYLQFAIQRLKAYIKKIIKK